jgi:hypothetical protein
MAHSFKRDDLVITTNGTIGVFVKTMPKGAAMVAVGPLAQRFQLDSLQPVICPNCHVFLRLPQVTE